MTITISEAELDTKYMPVGYEGVLYYVRHEAPNQVIRCTPSCGSQVVEAVAIRRVDSRIARAVTEKYKSIFRKRRVGPRANAVGD